MHKVAVGIEQGRGGGVERQVDDLADIDGVRAGRQPGHYPAIERHRTSLQHRRTGGERGPFAHVMEALVAFHAVHAGETLGDLAVIGRQDIDAEETGLADRIVGTRRLVDAHQDLWRLGRHRAHGGRRQPATQLMVAGGDQGHAGGEVAHALFEGSRIDGHGRTLGQAGCRPPPERAANRPAGQRNRARCRSTATAGRMARTATKPSRD